MGLLASFIAPEQRGSIQGPLPITASAIVDWLGGGTTTAAGVTINADSALKLTAVWACVRIISEDVAGLPLGVFEATGEQTRRSAMEHPLHAILHDSPNPWMTAMQFRETLQGHLLLAGNAYANIERNGFGMPVALWPLNPARMDTPVESANGTLLYTYTLPSGERRSLSQSEVLHIRGLSSDGIVGYSPVAYHRETYGLTDAALKYGSRFFANDSRPGGVLQSKGRLSKEAAERLRTGWELAHRGLEAAHRIAVLEEGIEWKQMGLPPEDAQFIQTRNFQVQDIARIYRMPPHKIGELSRATFANIEEQSLEYVTDTLRTWLVRWEQQINKDLFPRRDRPRYYVKHNMDAFLRASTVNRATAYKMFIESGVYSANDARALEDMNPFEGGDVHLQPLNFAPYGTEPEPEPEADGNE